MHGLAAGAAPLPATPCSLFHVPQATMAAAAQAMDGSVSLTLSFGHSIKVLTNKWTDPSKGRNTSGQEYKWEHPRGAVKNQGCSKSKVLLERIK